MSKLNTIGILTSGGDAPGMNAAIRAVVRTCKYYDLKIMGIRKGFEGLLHGDVFEMTARSVSDTLNRGGTILQTARSKRFIERDGVLQGIATAKYNEIDGIVVIGGDGSFKGARDLCKEGMPCVCIPGTIDNDIGCTDYTIGYNTAVTTAIDAVDKIRDTASSHERCNIIKVMGRHSGNIALAVGITTGAEAVLIPERPINFEKDILGPIYAGKRRSKQHFIIILAEGVADSDNLEKRIEEETGITTRTTTLGYLQRGGTPSARDRLVASQMGFHAVKAFMEGNLNRVVCMREDKIIDMDIFEALEMKYEVKEDLIELAKILSI